MDISSKIHELKQDILSFGEVISHTENPADVDLHNACNLFSQHITYQLQVIHDGKSFLDSPVEMQNTTAQLSKLSELLAPKSDLTQPGLFRTGQQNFDLSSENHWPEKLLEFCSQLQSLGIKAA